MARIADRLRGIVVSASAAMTDKARDLQAEGTRIISLSSGEPDFPTPPHAIEAAGAAARSGDTKYPPQDGTRALRQAVQAKFRRENGLDYAIEEILTANGAKQIIFDALMATCDPGDEVLIPAPGWITYADIARIAGAVPRPLPCQHERGFRMDLAALEAAITPRSRWLILNSPNNPTGAILSAEELERLAAVLLRHPDLWVLTDDIYEHIRYDDVPFHTIAAIEPRLKERVLTVNGVSKAYAMTGWRVGYCGGPAALIAAMSKVQLQATGGICTLSQAAATAVLEGPRDLLKERAAIYRQRRDSALAILRQSPGLTCHTPEGAFYLFPNIAGCLGRTTPRGQRIDTDTDFVMALLDEQHVAVVQGTAYGLSPFIRVSYATSLDLLQEGCRRIQAFCHELR